MNRSSFIAALLLFCCPSLAETVSVQTPADAFREGSAEARSRGWGDWIPDQVDTQTVPGLDESLSIDPGTARRQGELLRSRCLADDESPGCAGIRMFEEQEPTRQRYPLAHDDAVFRGAAGTGYPVGLGLDGISGCRRITLSLAESKPDEFACLMADKDDGKDPVRLLAPTGGTLAAKVKDSGGSVRTIDISSDGWIRHLLYGVHDLAVTLSLADPSLVSEARLLRIRYDDWVMVAVNGKALFVGPHGGDRLELSGLNICHAENRCSTTWDFRGRYGGWHGLGIDILPMLVPGENVIAVRLLHGGHGRVDLQGRLVLSAEYESHRRRQAYLASRLDVRTCSELEGRDCFQRRRARCAVPASGGGCSLWEFNYKCPASEPSVTLACPQQEAMFCADGSCFDRESKPVSADEFARSVSMLELARQAGSYLDPDSLRMFTGHPAHCRSRAFGLTDCCKADSGGGGMSNSDVHAALASNAVSEGIRFAGSTHVYDALFMADAPDMLLNLFPGSGLSYAPGVSFYGIQASYTGASGLVVSFDPASFAIAVGLVIAQNLLACDQAEQTLALRKGRGLCVAVGSYCSRDTLFGCATEKTGHCCYNSRLARIVSAEGRRQTGRLWGSPPRPECEGFTEDEIRRIDFDQIDFSEAFSDVAPANADELAERFRVRARKFVDESTKETGKDE